MTRRKKDASLPGGAGPPAEARKTGRGTAAPDIDREILLKAREGDHSAFARIVRQYEGMVYNFSFHVCRDKEYAEQTLQDTFVNVFRKLGQFDGKSKFSTWLYSIVANNCLMKRRRPMLEQKSVSLDEHASPADGDSPLRFPASKSTPLDDLVRNELREKLEEAVEKLPLDHRLVFILRDIEGQSAAEAARIMNISVPTVKSRLRRARIFLRNELREYARV